MENNALLKTASEREKEQRQALLRTRQEWENKGRKLGYTKKNLFVLQLLEFRVFFGFGYCTNRVSRPGK